MAHESLDRQRKVMLNSHYYIFVKLGNMKNDLKKDEKATFRSAPQVKVKYITDSCQTALKIRSCFITFV